MRHQVIVRRKGQRTYEELIRSVMDGLNILGKVRAAKRILIKPNLVTAKTSEEGVTVDTVLLRHLVEALRELTDADIAVGEGSLANTEGVFRHLGIYGLEKFGCRVVNFEKDDWVEVYPPFKLLFKKMLIPKTAFESDLIFNISKMKTHELTGVTLGIKNFFGLLSRGGRKFAHLKGIDMAIVDVFSYFALNGKVVSIIDALISLSGRAGPIIGEPMKTDRVYAGTNTVLCDAAGASSMGADPRQIGHIALASEVLGVPLGEPTAPCDSGMKFDVPLTFRSAFRPVDWVYGKLFYKSPYQADTGLCVSCRRCESICPMNIARIENGTFKYDDKSCIRCLCCVEACDTGSMSYKVNNERLFLMARRCRSVIRRSPDKNHA